MRTIGLAAICSASLAFAAVGCGGSEKNSPTKQEFVSQANSICQKAGHKLEAAGQSFFTGGGAQKTEADFVNQKVAPIFQHDLLDPIEALGAPKGDEDKVSAILDAGHQAIVKLKAHPLLIKAPPGSAKDPFRDLGRLATAYGLRCA